MTTRNPINHIADLLARGDMQAANDACQELLGRIAAPAFEPLPPRGAMKTPKMPDRLYYAIRELKAATLYCDRPRVKAALLDLISEISKHARGRR